MKYSIEKEYPGHLRVKLHGPVPQEDLGALEAVLKKSPAIADFRVYPRIGSLTLAYSPEADGRKRAMAYLCAIDKEMIDASREGHSISTRSMTQNLLLDLATMTGVYFMRRLFLPAPISWALTLWGFRIFLADALRSLGKARLDVPVLDASAVAMSLVQGDKTTAGETMFLLHVGETLEDYTQAQSESALIDALMDLAETAHKVEGDIEREVRASDLVKGDVIVVRMGMPIPVDGEVVSRNAMVNQASLTGESVAVRKAKDAVVYAGTVVEEGEITILVNQTKNSSRFEKIVAMIEESEKLKSGLESKAEHLADRLVPYSLGGTILTYLLTRNVTKALSILMVDFSCALKLAMPISVLSAIREANSHDITVKGGKFLEAMAEADTIVFDKTGTLTKARPTVADVVSFNGETPDELLRTAACLEEHFPHSMAKAVVNAAMEKNLQHEEMHTKVEYVVAHGISTMINNKKVIIGSYHFVFEDEKSIIPEDKKDLFNTLPEEYSHLYMAIDGVLAAVICIEDPLRKEAEDVVRKLHKAGFTKIVMMTGDSERTAKAVAGRVGVDEYYSEVLPEDKAGFIEKEKAAGRKVVMIGDGINDSPALSAADVGIAISDGAEIAREIADITIGADDLYRVVTLKNLSDALMKRIGKNYRTIVGFNSMLILLGVAGVIQPTTSALLHNSSTLLIGLENMKNLLD